MKENWVAAVDVRCLQDHNYAGRGVGRHALSLLRGAPDSIRLVGLFDPALPPLAASALALLHRVHPNAYAAEMSARSAGQSLSAFISLSPMTHDPLFTARLVANRALLRATVVYDFIPRHEPERYLSTPVARVQYATALAWLGRHNLFASISEATRTELGATLGVAPSASILTGASIDASFETIRLMRHQHAQTHFLVVGGGDPRKNPEVVIRAHARSTMLQRKAIPLVIAGNYHPADASAFRALAEGCGGDPDLLQVPGRISDDALFELYARSIAIICASRDEGFSLPVVESMAADVPSLVSDIPAHRELVTDPELRFPAQDDVALLALLERAASDSGWREQIIASQAGTWPRFRAEAVAGQFWSAVLSRLRNTPEDTSENAVESPMVNRGSRPKLAIVSPMPPDRSGVADYTAATCVELGKLAELHVFSELVDPAPAEGVQRMLPTTALPHLRPAYDRVVSVIGNSYFHLTPFKLMRRYGAACIAHDARMIGFYRILLGAEHALATASREVGRPVEQAELDGWMADEATMKALFLGEIAECASPSIVHYTITVDMFQNRYGVKAEYIPFSIYRPWSALQLVPAARQAARNRLGVGKDDVLIATFGFVQDVKAPEECVWALELLRSWGVRARLGFVGATYWMPDKGSMLRTLIARLGLENMVTFADGFVPEQTYQDYLVGSDLGIQLRTYGFGGLSGGLLDCAAAGLRTVTNASMGEAVGVPRSYSRFIPDAISPVLIAEAVMDLLEAGPSPAQREEDRASFSEERSFRRYAASLCNVLGL